MNIAMKDKKYRFTWVGFGAVALSLTGLSLLLSTGACSQVDGSRCDPDLSHDECDNSPTVQCVTPAGTGNSYCCTVSAGAESSAGDPGVLMLNGVPGGTIMDDNPNCQTSGPPGSEGQTCPLGTPCWTTAGCVAPNGTNGALCAGTSTDAGDDAESDDAAATGSDASDASVVNETSTPEEASVEASTSPEAATEASVSKDGASE
jgi:hypothetical protein